MEGEGWGDERGTKELSFFLSETSKESVGKAAVQMCKHTANLKLVFKLGITLKFGDIIAYVVTNVRIIVTEEIMS